MRNYTFLPCPFCGSPVAADECPYPYGRLNQFFKVVCTGDNCGACILANEPDQAVAQWNTRVSSAVSDPCAMTRASGTVKVDYGATHMVGAGAAPGPGVKEAVAAQSAINRWLNAPGTQQLIDDAEKTDAADEAGGSK